MNGKVTLRVLGGTALVSVLFAPGCGSDQSTDGVDVPTDGANTGAGHGGSAGTSGSSAGGHSGNPTGGTGGGGAATGHGGGGASAGMGGKSGSGGSSGGKGGAPVGAGGMAGAGGAPTGTGGMAGTGGSGGLAGNGGGGAGQAGGGGASAGGSGGGALVVEPFYPVNGPFWNDYVKADAGDPVPLADVACDPVNDGPTYAGCRHAGEIRSFVVPGTASCAGLTAVDSLGAFDWGCVEKSGQAVMVSTHLKSDKRLADLIDFAALKWRTASVTVSNGGGALATSETGTWWANPIFDGVKGAQFITPHDIYLGVAPGNYVMNGDKVAFTVDPATPLAGTVKVIGNFAWVEGVFGAPPGQTVSLQQGAFSVVRKIDITMGMGGGVLLTDMRASTVTDVDADLVATGAASGLEMKTSTGITVARITTKGASSYGVTLEKVSGSSFEDLADTGAGSRSFAFDASSSTFKRLSSTGATVEGLLVEDFADGNSFEDVVVRSSNGTGITTHGASSRWKNIRIIGTRDEGLTINSGGGAGTGFANTFEDVLLADTSRISFGALFVAGSCNVFNHVRVFGAGSTAVATSGRNNRIADIISAGANNPFNLGEGLKEGGLVLQNATAANALANATSGTGNGLAVLNGSRKNIHNLLSGNSQRGVVHDSMGTAETLYHDVVAVETIAESVDILMSGHARFDGALVLGTTATMGPTCVVGPGAVGVDAKCLANGNTTAAITTGVKLLPILVGPVTDTANTTNDGMGQTAYGATMDLEHFENTERGWGKTGIGTWPSVDQQGECKSGDTCQIFDYSLRATDLFALNMAGGIPSGNDVWVAVDVLTGGIAPVNQASCDADAPGSVFVAGTPAVCQIVYLKNAVELMSDGIGDDDTLCESGETCLFSPNAGAYQGHGALVSAGAFVDGQLTGITLMRYATNGR